MQGVTTHVSSLKINTNWTTYLKKNPDTRSLAPSLLSILDIFCQTNRAFVKFHITARQSSSASDSTLPRYLKDGNISRVRP